MLLHSPGSARRAKLLIGCVSICLTTAAALAIGEIYLRLARDYITPDTLRAKSVEYEATLFARHAFPRMVQKKNGGPSGYFEVNERGYRGRSFEVPKPRGLVRVVVLGGSSAWDAFAREGRDWPRLAEGYLRARGHSRVEVINAAIPGHATFDSLGLLYSEIWMFEPDYVLIYEAWNDLKYFHRLEWQSSLLRVQRPAAFDSRNDNYLVSNPFIYYAGPVDRFLSHSQLYVRLRSRYLQWQLGKVGTEGVVINPESYANTYSPYGPRQYELNLRLIVAAARHIGAKAILATQARLVTTSNTPAERETIAYEFVNLAHDTLVRAFADCDEAVFRVARAENVPVLDLSGMFTGRAALFADHTHTTAAGSEALAHATADFLGTILSKN
jgi:lysophospholipase L1-like esterase